jgi:hypothetical protein
LHFVAGGALKIRAFSCLQIRSDSQIYPGRFKVLLLERASSITLSQCSAVFSYQLWHGHGIENPEDVGFLEQIFRCRIDNGDRLSAQQMTTTMFWRIIGDLIGVFCGIGGRTR